MGAIRAPLIPHDLGRSSYSHAAWAKPSHMRPAHLLPLAALALLAAAPPSLRREGGGSDARLRGLDARAAQGRAHARDAAGRLAALNAREAELAARIGHNRGELIRLLGALERWRSDPPPALVVSPARAVDAARGALLMHAITPELQRRARVLAEQAHALNGVRREAAQADAALFAAQSQAADADEAAGAIQAASDAAPTIPQARVAQAGARAEAGAGQTGAAPPAPPPAPPPDRLLAPVEGAPVLRWGQPWLGRGEALGVVWRAAPGAAVTSPASGVVEYAGPLKGFRLVVILRLAGDWRVVLTGLQEARVGVGREVAAGRPLGRAPPAGSGDGEVYLQLRDGAVAVDPSAALRLAASPPLHARPGA